VLWWDECDNFVLLYKINPQIRFICEKALEVPRDKQPNTSTGATPVTPPLESGRVLEGHGCPGCWGRRGGADCLRCVFFSSIASYWTKYISSPPWAGCAFRIYDWLRAQSLARLGPNTLAINASADNIGIATRYTATDPGLATPSFHHASAGTLVPELKRSDVICSMEVVEHVDNPAAFLGPCAELVKVRLLAAVPLIP
jgi:hypothetical protein